MLGLYKVEVVEYDTLISADFDLTDSKVLAALLARIHSGEFYAAVIGTPCSTFSVARIRKAGVKDDGPPQVRNLKHTKGMPNQPEWAYQGDAQSARVVPASARCVQSPR